MNKVYYDWEEMADGVNDIILHMFKDNWKPDMIVGLTRGGLTPAVLLSNKTGIPMHTLDVRLRDTHDGYVPEENQHYPELAKNGTKILIVDDINDTGETLEYIQNSWDLGDVWESNVRVGCIVNNESSNVEIDYYSIKINKLEDPCWIVFPWEG